VNPKPFLYVNDRVGGALFGTGMIPADGGVSGYLDEAAMGCAVGYRVSGLSAVHPKEVPISRRADIGPSHAASCQVSLHPQSGWPQDASRS
jgi:hypothetical protein